MGKGLPAAIIGAATKNVLLQKVQSLQGREEGIPAIQCILEELTRGIYDKLNKSSNYLTLFYLRLDLSAGKGEYISCGHPGAVRIQSNDQSYHYLKGQNMPLGVQDEVRYESISFDFAKGDRLVLYTDGILEALQNWSEKPPIEAFKECLGDSAMSVEETASKIFSEAEKVIGDKDDMTVVTIENNNDGEKEAPVPIWLQRNFDEIYRLDGFLQKSPGENDSMFKVAVIETFTNIVKHSEGADSSIKVYADQDPEGRKVLCFNYEGDAFNPEAIKLPDCTQQTNGFGLYLIEKICHAVE